MFGWFKKRSLESALFPTKRVKVQGVIFHLRKLDPLDYVAGAKALHMHFELYKTKGQKEAEAATIPTVQKIKEHYTDVIMAAVVEPKLSRKADEPGAIHVDNLFTEWTLVEDLYLKILEVTYGKKKLKHLRSLKSAS